MLLDFSKIWLLLTAISTTRFLTTISRIQLLLNAISTTPFLIKISKIKFFLTSLLIHFSTAISRKTG